MKGFHIITFTLLVVGGLNWLAVGAFGLDLGQWFGGQDQLVSRVIYVSVGLAAIAEVIMHKKACRLCGGSSASVPTTGVGM